MLNKVILMGRLAADPELKTTQSGVSAAVFRLAVERNYAPQGQERPCDFISCIAWRQTGEFIAQYFQKGSLIAVEGSLQTRAYTDRNGQKRTLTEVIVEKGYFGGTNGSGNANGTANAQRSNNSGQRAGNGQRSGNQQAQAAPNPAGQAIIGNAEMFGIGITPWEETADEDLPF